MRNIIDRIEAALEEHELVHGVKATRLRLGRKDMQRLREFALKYGPDVRLAIESGVPASYNDIPIEEMQAEWYLTAVAPGADCCGHAETKVLVRRGNQITVRGR